MKSLGVLCSVILMLSLGTAIAETREGNNEILFKQLQSLKGLSAGQVARVKAIFRKSGSIGQGNPSITRHPMSVEQCLARLPGGRSSLNNSRFRRICGAKYMAPLYDPATQRPEDAKACIDQFEYPNIPCTYPVTWVKASEAAAICAAEGKRLCDAHEWEGACAGSVGAPDYRFDLAAGASASGAVNRMRSAHNAKYGGAKNWAYGKNYRKGVCAANSTKSPGCNGGNFRTCGTNTYPSASFSGCVSKLKVYDLHGNAAEHMNLPLKPSQMASANSGKLGVTEMKGSWFIWDKYNAHPDWCRWRAPFWHGAYVQSSGSHSNYHLGFRCCKSTR